MLIPSPHRASARSEFRYHPVASRETFAFCRSVTASCLRESLSLALHTRHGRNRGGKLLGSHATHPHILEPLQCQQIIAPPSFSLPAMSRSVEASYAIQQSPP